MIPETGKSICEKGPERISMEKESSKRKGPEKDDNSQPSFAAGYEKGGVPQNVEGHARLASFFASA